MAVRLVDATEPRHVWLVSRDANQTRMTTHFIELVTRPTRIAAGRGARQGLEERTRRGATMNYSSEN